MNYLEQSDCLKARKTTLQISCTLWGIIVNKIILQFFAATCDIAILKQIATSLYEP